MSVREILTYPNPILREVSKPVTEFNADLKKLAHDMLETMYDANGIGLAAPQVGELKRLLVIDTRPKLTPEEIEKNYQLYVESLSKPMPFYIGVPVAEGNKMKINWDNSYSFDAEDITYSVEIARDYLFQDVIYTQDGLLIPETELELPEAGQYFIRVRATNEKGKTQDAFDYYVTDEGKQYGMRCIYVTEDGQIEEDIYEE